MCLLVDRSLRSLLRYAPRPELKQSCTITVITCIDIGILIRPVPRLQSKALLRTQSAPRAEVTLDNGAILFLGSGRRFRFLNSILSAILKPSSQSGSIEEDGRSIQETLTALSYCWEGSSCSSPLLPLAVNFVDSFADRCSSCSSSLLLISGKPGLRGQHGDVFRTLLTRKLYSTLAYIGLGARIRPEGPGSGTTGCSAEPFAGCTALALFSGSVAPLRCSGVCSCVSARCT